MDSIVLIIVLKGRVLEIWFNFFVSGFNKFNYFIVYTLSFIDWLAPPEGYRKIFAGQLSFFRTGPSRGSPVAFHFKIVLELRCTFLN